MRDTSQVPLRTYDPATWSALRAAGRARRVPRGEVLLSEGDVSDFVVLIEEGALKIAVTAENGSVTVLAIRRAGEMVGEFAAVENRRRCATVTALDPSTVVIVGGSKLRATLDSRPETAVVLLRNAIARLHEADRRRAEFGSYDVAERIRRVLSELAHLFRAEGAPACLPVLVPLVQQDLAGLAGASREATARVLRKLRETGVVRTERSRITVLRPDLLGESA